MTKDNTNSFHLPPLGQRITRSVTAVALCFAVYFIRGMQGIPFYSALAALQCMQPYHDSMTQMAKKRIIGTFIGAFWGLAFLLFEFYVLGGRFTTAYISYLLMALMVGVVLYSTVVLGVKETAYFSCVVFLCITVNHIADENPFLFTLNRVVDTLIGVALAFAVNSFHLPRRKNKDILFVSGIDETLLDSFSHLSDYSRIELNRLIDSGACFTVSTSRTPASVREAVSGVTLNHPIIAMDGAVLYDMTDNSYLMKFLMSPYQVKRLSEFLKSEGFTFFTNTITEDLLVIYYEFLSNEAEQGIYQVRRKSPYRNYVRTDHQMCDHVVYLLIIDNKFKIEALHDKLLEQPWFSDFRMTMSDSKNYPGNAYIKIYHKDANREHMLEILKSRLHMNKTVTFGSIEGKYDILISNNNRDEMVHKLRNLYEPVIWSKES